MTIAPPPNLTSLTARIRNAATAGGRVTRRVELIVADTAIGQMLPSGVLKGGAAMQIDVARNVDPSTHGRGSGAARTR